MRNLLFMLLLFPLVFSCRDQPEKNRNIQEDVQMKEPASDTVGIHETIAEESATEKDGVLTEEPIKETDTEISDTGRRGNLEGGYIRTDPPELPDGCNCYCLEISFSTPTQLCIAPDDIYINARFTPNGNAKANVYFVEMVRSETKENEIPWGDLDKNTPIATAELQPDGTLKFDWLGFAINGELAVDYAIFGKKSLEGIYKKR